MNMRCLSIYLDLLKFLSMIFFVVFRVQVLYFSDKLFLKYFIVFDAFVIIIVFLISFSDCSLLVYRNTTVFCILILYSEPC